MRRPGSLPINPRRAHAGHGDFDADAWRVVSNVMLDRHFFNVDPWQDTFATKLGAFFESKG